MFAPPIAKAKPAPAPARSVLQRKCACGARAAGDCASCAGKEMGLQRNLAIGPSNDPLEREADRVAEQVLAQGPRADFGRIPISVQRHAPTERSQSREAPPSVGHALAMAGRPLEAPLRRDMEMRFGQDFSQVRVHQGGPAERSARDIGASAYTVGNDIVFGRGQFVPSNASGRRLLAHELTHFVQQNGAARNGAADSNGPFVPSAAGFSLQRQFDTANTDMTDGLTEAATQDLQDTPDPVCGPDVTKEVQDACSSTKTRFEGWDEQVKTDNCEMLISYISGPYAWDIVDLHSQKWIHDNYSPQCASEDATPSCWSSIQVGKNCYYAGSANYVIFGVMFSLCHDYFKSIDSSDASDFTAAEMLGLVAEYKGGYHWWLDKSANFEPSKQWAYAGYKGWPATTSPAGDRPNCSPTCPLKYKGDKMKVSWGDPRRRRAGESRRRWGDTDK